MKLLDKLKNALFEEEYVEVEEKPKRKEIIKEKKVKEPIVREKTLKKEHEEIKKEKPIAKKIVQEDKKEKEEELELLSTKDEHLGESLAYQPKQEENDFKFPMVSDNEFKTDDYLKEEPKKPRKVKKQEEQHLYQGKKNTKSKPYGLDDLDLQEHEYGAYERKEEKTYFKPSPIISPIYGILDKNYTKEDIIPKKEIRLTSSYARENINFDDVRKKAFGTLEIDIEREIESSEIYDDIEEDDANSLLDLSSDNKTPEVSKVTMGDAEEYFEDLGLEYNVDYKDTSKEKATGRRSKKEYDNSDLDNNDITEDIDSTELNNNEPQIIDSKPQKEVKISDSNEMDDDDDDNLFDLIDSMYDKE